jgi:hypothetical protein
MRRVPAASHARQPSSREVWVNAMAEFCDALTWDMLTSEEREINLAIDAWMARRRLQKSAASAPRSSSQPTQPMPSGEVRFLGLHRSRDRS